MPVEIPQNSPAGATSPALSPVAPGDYRWAMLAFCLLWAAVFFGLRGEWNETSAYSYGAFIPPLAAYFLFRRWADRPLPPTRSESSRPTPAKPAEEPAEDPRPGRRRRRSAPPVAPAPKDPLAPRQVALIVVLAAAALLLPTRLIQEANADWRFANILHASLAVIIGLSLVFALGGFRWSRHFIPVIVLMLFAVPWPDRLEQFITNGLMRRVAGLTVDLLNDVGIAAAARGNVIELASGAVGIDEACSGIRSLQLCLALGYFLALLRGLGIGRGLILLGTGVATALLANLARTFGLSLAQASGGFEALERWHDRAGVIELLFILAALWFAAVFLTPKAETAAPGTGRPPAFTLLPVPVRLCQALCLMIVGTEILTAGWFWWNERREPANAAWAIRYPEKAKGYREVFLSERIKRELRCDSARAAVWEDEKGQQWSILFARWKEGRPISRRARVHRPENCFPANGRALRADLGTLSVPSAAGPVPFRAYVFDHIPNAADARDLFVYYDVWENRLDRGLSTSQIASQPLRASRIAAVWQGLRTPEQRTVEFTLLGPANAEVANRALEAALPQILVKAD